MAVAYRLGLDIGIGSIGWAVISDQNDVAHIEDVGVRCFDSGEREQGKSRTSQERRGFRGVRRLGRRCTHRKDRLKAHLQNIGFINIADINSYLAEGSSNTANTNIFTLKVKALTEQITPEELAACLIHSCNHRGYHDFYAEDEAGAGNITAAAALQAAENSENSKKGQKKASKAAKNAENGVNDEAENEEEKEARKSKAGAQHFAKLFHESQCCSVSAFLLQNKMKVKGNRPYFRNRNTNENFMLIGREFTENETQRILKSQQRYYRSLSDGCIETIMKIIFKQRDFEDGPGDPEDKFRRYTGFLESLGRCPFYPNEKRGFRKTLIGDCFAVANALSQYQYSELADPTAPTSIPARLADKAIEQLIANGGLSWTDVNKLAKSMGIEVRRKDSQSDDLPKAVRFLNIAKKCVDESGEDWQEFIAEEQFNPDQPSRLHKIAEFLSTTVTPSRRRSVIKKQLPFMSPALVEAFVTKNLGGTSGASYRYMCDSIAAFREGDVVGKYQANAIKAREALAEATGERQSKISPQAIRDEDTINNPVVFRSINEVRKLVNAIVDVYGQPLSINVEVAQDLNRVYSERKKVQDQQKKNEAERDRIKKEICEKICHGRFASFNDVPDIMVDKYKLAEQQQFRSMYSGKPLGTFDEILNDPQHRFEVDHILPYSRILDNTLNNKVLVFASENQAKKNRTPLMYLHDLGEGAVQSYLARVNELRRGSAEEGKKNSQKSLAISEKKYRYLMLENLFSPEAIQLMDDWKSRNINDTRYITKYIVELLKRKLLFADNEPTPVRGIKGGLTSKFRRIWLRGSDWGDEKKKRESTLNHAVDAVVIANFTPFTIELASDVMKLQQLSRYCYDKDGEQTRDLPKEYWEYFNNCMDKYINKSWHKSGNYIKPLLGSRRTVPALIADLRREVEIRFDNTDPELLRDQVAEYYGDYAFVREPRIPVTSRKPSHRFRGTIADSNPIKVREVGRWESKKLNQLTAADLEHVKGLSEEALAVLQPVFAKAPSPETSLKELLKAKELKALQDTQGKPLPGAVEVYNVLPQKISRKKISELTKSSLSKLYTNDSDLRSTLERILGNAPDDKYTVQKYLNENGLKQFVTDRGQMVVHRVSLLAGPVTNFYKKDIRNCSYANYSLMGMLKYYCVEIYRDQNGLTRCWGIRYIDCVRKEGKLYVKSASLPNDYVEHVCYLFVNDCIGVVDKKGIVKFLGYYNGVDRIVKNRIRGRSFNSGTILITSISSTDSIYKCFVNLLGDVVPIKKPSLPFTILF